MPVAITIRNVPDEVRDELARRAKLAGKSLQEYLRGMLVDITDKPPLHEVLERARARVEASDNTVTAESILAARDADRR